jgi:hypothetical protein
MGRPLASKPWGFQLDGQHAIVNCFVLGDQVMMTPHFAGSEPVRATAGKYAGTVVLQLSKAYNTNLTEAFKGNLAVLKPRDRRHGALFWSGAATDRC